MSDRIFSENLAVFLDVLKNIEVFLRSQVLLSAWPSSSYDASTGLSTKPSTSSSKKATPAACRSIRTRSRSAYIMLYYILLYILYGIIFIRITIL